MLTTRRPYTERVTMAALCVAAAVGLAAHSPGGGPETLRSPASGHERHGGSGHEHRVDGHHHVPSTPPPRSTGKS
ncbi:hypothetical protein [Streptomyces xinghaiensis]|uniref:hypothetical protein n=1 Tax=Streptomyces xinghaiensis TaxID=1038928 RepID=UPI00341785C9